MRISNTLDGWRSEKEIFKRSYGVLGLVGMVGLGILGYGVLMAVVPEKPSVEIISQQEGMNGELSKKEIVVDVAGAVEKPGVYKMSRGARVGDVLVMAGGFSVTADRGWVARYLNLAREVEDGGKIYIPDNSTDLGKEKVGKSITQNGLINVNTASVSELESLWGIGEARAAEIIANRPYGMSEELMSKAKIPQTVFEKIKDEIAVY